MLYSTGGDCPSKAKRVQGRECLAERNEAKPTIRCSRHRTVRERPSHFVRRPASVRNSKHRTPNLKRGDTMRLRSMEVPNQRLRSPAAMEIRLGQKGSIAPQLFAGLPGVSGRHLLFRNSGDHWSAEAPDDPGSIVRVDDQVVAPGQTIVLSGRSHSADRRGQAAGSRHIPRKERRRGRTDPNSNRGGILQDSNLDRESNQCRSRKARVKAFGNLASLLLAICKV